MRFNILLACILVLASVAGVQASLGIAPQDSSTTTATLVTIYPLGTSNNYCGVDSVVIPFTGPVNINFTSAVPMDFYIFQTLNYIPCGEHLQVQDLTANECTFADWNATSLETDQNLAPGSKYFIFLVAWGDPATINGATATITMSGVPSTNMTTQASLTAYTSSSPTNSLQMPQPPQTGTAQISQNSSSNITSEAAIPLVVVAAIALYLLVRKHVRK